MACRKYTISNNGSFTQTYTYQECNNLMWNYDFTIEAGQRRTIWLIDGTYTAPATSTLSVTDDGLFPPIISPTPTHSITPTNTPTPSITPTQTSSPTPTPTVTPTPTNLPRTTLAGICHDEADPAAVCNCPGTATIFVDGTSLSDSTLAWADGAGPNTGDPAGYYVQGNIVYQVHTGCGIGCITGSTITVYGNCPTVTPTTTPTPTMTPTLTQTPTQTPTPSSTPTIQGFFFTLQEVGPDVVLSGTGSVDLASLIPTGPYSATPSFIRPSQGLFSVGAQVGGEEWYSGVTLSSPVSFGSGSATNADSSTGDILGLSGFGDVKVPTGYSGGLLNGTATFTGTTLSTLGVTVPGGPYLIQWGASGASETITLTVI